MSACNLCPRLCGADRVKGETGFCGQGALPLIARAAPHFGEEPCISGSRGSGAVFFSGCSLGCVFCQNMDISAGGFGQAVSTQRLADIFCELEDKGVHNLNLVTASHFTDAAAKALALAKPKIPVVWNSSGYELPEPLRILAGLVSIYMPDLKYSLPARAGRYSSAPDYPEMAKAAILEMYRQTGPFQMDSHGILKKGLLIRHLLLPGGLEDAFDLIDWISASFPKGTVLFSLLGQFTPLADPEKHPEISRRVTASEYVRALDYARLCGLESGYFQELSSATEELIPDFDLTGV